MDMVLVLRGVRRTEAQKVLFSEAKGEGKGGGFSYARYTISLGSKVNFRTYLIVKTT